MQIEALLDRIGILVLNATAYSGWNVSVDGPSVSWVEANYMFHGVFLSTGKHSVRFRYQPKSFKLGVTISELTAAGLLAFGFIAESRLWAKCGQAVKSALN